MAERVTDPEALAVWEATASELVNTLVGGSSHYWELAHAIMDTVKALRADPDLAARLGIGVPLR